MTSNHTRSANKFANWTILFAAITFTTLVVRAEEQGVESPSGIIEPTEKQLEAANAIAKRIGIQFVRPIFTAMTQHEFVLDDKPDDEALKRIPELPFSFGLRISGSGYTAEGLKELTKLKNLKSISIFRDYGSTDNGLTIADLNEIGRIPNLTSLFIAFNSNRDGIPLRELANRGNLTEFSLTFCSHVADDGLADMKNLTSLTMDFFAPGIEKLEKLSKLCLTSTPDEGIKFLTKLTQLKTLVLRNPEITDAGMKHIAEFINLSELHISYRGFVLSPAPKTKITSAGLTELSRMEKLSELSIDNMMVTDEGMKELSKLRRLEELALHNQTLTIEGYKAIANMETLTALYLNNSDQMQYGKGACDSGLKHLAGMKQLKTLGLDHTSVSDAGLTELIHLQNLTELNLRMTAVTDAGLLQLASMRQLRVLNLQFTKITDVGLKNMAKCQQLAVLRLQGCKVTPQAVKELGDALPKCVVWTTGQ